MKHICLGLRYILVVVCLFVSACGFQLRGKSDVAKYVDSVYLDAPTIISNEFRDALLANDIEFADGPAAADLVIKVNRDEFERRAVSVNPNTGKDLEFELEYLLDFVVVDKEGEIVVSNSQIKLYRDYIFDDELVLSSKNEETSIRKELRGQAVRGVLRKIEAQMSARL